MAKQFSHQDTKTHTKNFTKSFASCLRAFVAILPFHPG
jgi:hypothetical protein